MKRADDFKYVGIAERMLQQPIEMQLMMFNGHYFAAMEHALDIIYFAGWGYLGTPAHQEAERVRDHIRKEKLDVPKAEANP